MKNKFAHLCTVLWQLVSLCPRVSLNLLHLLLTAGDHTDHLHCVWAVKKRPWEPTPWPQTERMVRGVVLSPRLSPGHPSEQQHAGRKKPLVPCSLKIGMDACTKEILEWFHSFDLLDKEMDRQAASLLMLRTRIWTIVWKRSLPDVIVPEAHQTHHYVCTCTWAQWQCKLWKKLMFFYTQVNTQWNMVDGYTEQFTKPQKHRRGEGSSIERTSFSCRVCPKHLSYEHSWSEKRTTLCSKRRMHAQNVFFRLGPLPPSQL